MNLLKTSGTSVSHLLLACALFNAPALFAEIPEIDITAEGPWSDIEKTTLTVPLVANGSISIDGDVSQEEYGNFPGQLIDPGDNGRIHNFPGDRQWDDAADSSFTFWLAHDETYFYVGVDAKDDVINQDDPNAALWKDDSIEIVVDALNDRYDNNTDNSMDPFGGHCYISYDGKFSAWDEETMETDTRWSTAVEWTYGEDGEVWCVGKEVDGGWQLDMRFAKTLFEDPDAGNKLEDGYVMGFNIGMDDDDKFGPGLNGDGSRTQDLELQYFWANRARLEGWSAEEAENYTAEQIANGDHEADFDPIINQTGRLAHGGSGEIIFSNENPFELTPGPNITVSSKKRLGQLDSANPTYAEVVTVRNTGTENDLTISGVNVVGTDMALFTVDEFPMTLAPQTSGEIMFTFSPEGRTGDFAATLEIVSDDVDADDQTRLVDVTASVVNLSGPKAHYALDEAAGATDMSDITGFGNGGVYVSSPTLGVEALASGTAMEVSGSNYGQADGSALGTPDGFTISTWVNASANAGSQTIVAKGDDGNPTFALLLTGDALDWFVGDSAKFSTPAGAVIAGQSYFVTVTWTADRAAIYVDGVEAASQDEPDALELSNSNPIFIGSFAGVLSFSGVIDDVQIYDRVLSGEEIQFLMANPGEVIGGTAPPVDPVSAEITWEAPNLDTTVEDLIGGPSLTFTPFAYDGGNAEGTFWTGDGGTTGDDVLDSIYNSHGWNGAGASITLDGLTAGESYQVQLLGAGDTRGCCNTRNQAASDGTNVSGDFPRGNSSVIGSFTATGATQEIMIVSGTDNGVDPGLSGFILTDADGGFISASNVGRTEGDNITLTVPTGGDGPLDLLVLGADDTGETGADANVLAFLGETFGADNVRYQNSGATDGSETADVIIMSSTFGSGSVRGKFHNSAVPIVNWEEAIMDAGDGEFGQSSVAMTKSTDTVRMALSDHLIAGDLAGTTIDFFSAAGAETLGSSSLSAGTEAVGTAADGSIADLAMLFVTEAGAAVAEGAGVTDNVSPARRVAFPMTDSSFDSLTDEGKQLFVNSIRWAAGGDSPPTGLDGYWSFDEGTGTVAGDGSGNGRDAAFRNGEPMWVAGKSGGALAFDGDDDLTIAGWKGIGGAAPRTISYWMKTDWGVSSVGGNVAWGTSETGLKWHFRLNENANNGPVGAIRTEIQGSFHISTQVVNDDVWHHVVSIFPEGGQFMQDLVHYIDGELQEVGGTGSTTVEVDTAGEANGGTDVTFGSRLQGATDQYYIGAMDDISIWSRALTAEEVQALSKGATPLDVAAGNLDVVTSDGLPPLTSVNRTASGVAISVPDGETYDIQYSTDLIEWESIAPGTTGAYEDTDAGRTGGASGYYRGIQP